MTRSTRNILAKSLLASGLLAASLGGCTPPHPDAAKPYEDCKVQWDDDGPIAAPCRGGTTVCLDEPLDDENAFDDGAGICSQTCMVTSDCPMIADSAVECELFQSGRICLVKCQSDDDCPRGTGCDDLDRNNGETVRRCMP
jgi:hypothetical protein